MARFGSVKEDLDKQLKTVIANALDRLDLVTREEFEIQQELNTRLAARVAALEARLAELAGKDQTPQD